MNARACALDNIISIIEKKEPLHLVLGRSLKGIEDENDRAFTARLTRGVVERCLTLDSIINSKTETKTDRQKPVIRNILRSGVYQILFMDGVTDFAACDEAVKLAGKRGYAGLGGFVNGMLRAVCRDEKLRNTVEGWKSNSVKNNPVEAPERMRFKYSMPEWISADWIERYGVETVEAAYKYFFKDSGISVRCNSSKLSPEELKERLLKQGLEVKESSLTPRCFKLSGRMTLERLTEFKEGLFTVQDASSVFSGECVRYVFERTAGKEGGLSPQSAKVLDLCAAPGGKSLNMADMGFCVTACDLTEAKTSLINDAVNRCGFRNVSVKENDATVFNPEFEGSFDIVLCDLPCSGLGIIGKKPDIKYNMSAQKQGELVILQRIILQNAVRYVKKGGILCYSTCTVNYHENEEQAEYLEHELGMRPASLRELFASVNLAHYSGNRVQLLPGDSDCDGFFISVFIS